MGHRYSGEERPTVHAKEQARLTWTQHPNAVPAPWIVSLSEPAWPTTEEKRNDSHVIARIFFYFISTSSPSPN
jgi:hypothetical protein